MKQNTALTILQTGKNVFITGSAGTGKTYLLNLYITYLKERFIQPTIVAPTGIAASHLGGQTIHSFFALGIRESIDEGYVDFLLENKYLQTRFSKLKLLIIDEVSMISPEIFSAMDLILRSFKATDEPFGGVQVVISGDFFQLPPVSKTPKEKRFAWQSEAWKALNLQTCYLQEKFRQDDERLIRVLDDIRSGEISDASHQTLQSRYEKTLDSNLTPTKLYTHNIDVDRINLEELAKLNGESNIFIHEASGNEKAIEKIFKSSLVLEELKLKKGALVIFIKNNPEEGYLNGTTGTVESFSPIDKMPIVRTHQGKKIKLNPEEWSLENDSGKVIATISQVPLRLAWAITIHKSQGMTLDSAQMDLSKTFESGQGYVALSRIKSIEGLRLMGINEMALRVDPLILHVDKRIQHASQKASDAIEALSKEEIKKAEKQHILSLDGEIREEKIKEQRANIKAGKPSHSSYVTPTYIKTQNLIESSDTLIALATNRGLGKSTILGHLVQIKEENPDINLDKYKPKSEILERVEAIVLKLHTKKCKEHFSEEGKLRLKPIYEQLNGEVSYDDIRLCMVFIKL